MQTFPLYDGRRFALDCRLAPRSWALPLAASFSRVNARNGNKPARVLRLSVLCVLVTLIWEVRANGGNRRD
jgi:hypothetical protein